MRPTLPKAEAPAVEERSFDLSSPRGREERVGSMDPSEDQPLRMLTSMTLVVHRFRARGKRGSAPVSAGSKEATSAPEVPLSPQLAFLEAIDSVLGGITFVDSAYPEVGALGHLPAGYANGRPVGTEALLHLLRRLRPSSDGSTGAVELAWAARIERTLGRAVEMALWAHPPCYQAHTRPAVRRGAGAASRLFLAVYCRRRRRLAENALENAPQEDTIADLVSLLTALEAKVKAAAADAGHMTTKAAAGKNMQLDELVLLSHLRVLRAIPEGLAPWGVEVHKRLARLSGEFEALGGFHFAGSGSEEEGSKQSLYDWYSSDFDGWDHVGERTDNNTLAGANQAGQQHVPRFHLGSVDTTCEGGTMVARKSRRHSTPQLMIRPEDIEVLAQLTGDVEEPSQSGADAAMNAAARMHGRSINFPSSRPKVGVGRSSGVCSGSGNGQASSTVDGTRPAAPTDGSAPRWQSGAGGCSQQPEENMEEPSLSPAQRRRQRRANALVTAWWALSITTFAVWRWRRCRA